MKLFEDKDLHRFIESHLFFSADLTGSTRFKQDLSSDVWSTAVFEFYRVVEHKFSEQINKSVNALQFKSNYEKHPKVEIWKYQGDEVLFYAQVFSLEDVFVLAHCFQSVVEQTDKKLYELGQRLNKDKASNLGVKGTMWFAETMVVNKKYPDSENPSLDWDDTGEQRDFVGPTIDAGFRIAKFATDLRLIISVELAYLLLYYKTKKIEYANTDAIEIAFYGKENLKGVVVNGGDYPIFYLLCNSEKPVTVSKELSERERDLFTRNDAVIQYRYLEEFFNQNYASENNQISYPMLKNLVLVKDFYEAPPGRKDAVERYFQDLSKIRDRAMEPEDDQLSRSLSVDSEAIAPVSVSEEPLSSKVFNKIDDLILHSIKDSNLDDIKKFSKNNWSTIFANSQFLNDLLEDLVDEVEVDLEDDQGKSDEE